jgi:hypothetical protein
MPTCFKCNTYFRTLEGEEQDHECPKCGFSPEGLFEYVYCTNCIHFRIEDKYEKDDEGIPCCNFEDKCDITDCEDSKRRMDRPCYED